MLSQRGANLHSLGSARGLDTLLPASFVMLGALSVLTVAGWNSLNATGASRRWRELAFDFAAFYASSIFPENPQCRAQDVLDIPFSDSDTSVPPSPISDTSSESSCENKTTNYRQPRAPSLTIQPPRQKKARPHLPPLVVEPHLPMAGVLAENGSESPNPCSNESIMPSSLRPFKPSRKPTRAPIQTVRVDYDVLEDDDQPIAHLDPYSPPTASCSSNYPPIPNSPLALKLTFKPSPYPSAMQRRFHNLSASLTSETIQSLAPSIYSISIAIPPHPNGDVWVPQGLPNPFDGRITSANIRVDHPSVLDASSPLRYRNFFPNLEEFTWSGPLGRRYGRGSRSTGALPAPFYDLTSLPFGQLQRLELRRCMVTLSDCRHLLRSCPQLRACSVDQIVDVDPNFFEQPSGKATTHASQEPINGKLTAYPIFLPLCNPDDDTSCYRQSSPSIDPLISCPNLHTLHLRTTVDLCHFFPTFSTPALKDVVYAPSPGHCSGIDTAENELCYVTVENFPWNVGWETLETFELLVSEDVVVQSDVEELLDEIAGEEGVNVRVSAVGVDDARDGVLDLAQGLRTDGFVSEGPE